MRFYRPLKSVKAITFDLDDTLYDNGPVIRAAERQLDELIASQFPQAARLTPEQWRQIKIDLIRENPALASDMGQLRLQSLKLALANDVPPGPALDEAARSCFDCFYTARSTMMLDSQTLEILAELSARCPLVAITNGNVDPERIGIAPYFSRFLHASLSRPSKPHPHMFKEAALILGLSPGQVLHVGDNLEKDVFGAISAGMQAAWYAVNRPMRLNQETTRVLPHVQLSALEDLLTLV